MYKFTLIYPWIFLIVAVKAYLADENETGLGISELAEWVNEWMNEWMNEWVNITLNKFFNNELHLMYHSAVLF